mgnify:CR=1 FL=1
MSKLKKVLSLMLTAAMMLGMMLVPASAAQFKDAEEKFKKYKKQNCRCGMAPFL